MSDLAKWKLRGPVRTLRSETAEWDSVRDTWKPARYFTAMEFQTDGKITSSEMRVSDGSVSRGTFRYDNRGRLIEVQRGLSNGPFNKSIYSYDDAGRHVRTVNVDADGGAREAETCHYDSTGRKTKVSFLHMPALGIDVPIMHGIEGTDHSFGAPGATTMTTTYDAGDQPEEVVMHDANHVVVRRVTFTRDREGRVLSEAVQFGGRFPFPEMESKLPEASPQEVAALAAMIGAAFERQTLHHTTYAYDRHGRVLERTVRMGTLSEHRTIFRYDDRDNPIEEIAEDQDREIGAGEDGVLRSRNETVRRHVGRYEYQYDREGNWTERIVSGRIEPDPIFLRSNVERRQITYYGR